MKAWRKCNLCSLFSEVLPKESKKSRKVNLKIHPCTLLLETFYVSIFWSSPTIVWHHLSVPFLFSDLPPLQLRFALGTKNDWLRFRERSPIINVNADCIYAFAQTIDGVVLGEQLRLQWLHETHYSGKISWAHVTSWFIYLMFAMIY